MLVMERWQSWSIASDLKSDEVQASVGSNPTFSVVATICGEGMMGEELKNYKN